MWTYTLLYLSDGNVRRYFREKPMMTHHSIEGGGESWATAAWEASTAEDQEVRAEERKRSETFKYKRAEDPARHH